MHVILPLAQMTLAEKMQTMETLWDDLSHNSTELASPGWHSDILAARDSRLKEETEQVYDWDEAKKRIRGSI